MLKRVRQNSSAWNREMFLVFPLGSAKLKVGRMWEGDPFKGLMFIDVKDALTITYPVNAINLVASIVNMDDDANKNDNFFSLVGTYAPEGSVFSGSLGLYHRVTNDSSTSGTYIEDRPQYLAVALGIAQEPWTLGITGAFMFGDKDINTGGVSTSYDYKGYAFDIRAGYDFAKISNIPLTAEVIFGLGSGDDNPNDRDFESFQGISPGYFHGAIFKDVGDPRIGGAPEVLNHGGIEANGLGNQRMLALNLKYQATDDLSLGLFGGMFWLTEDKNVNLNATSGGATYLNNHIGNEVALTADYSLAKNLNLHLQAAWFMGDNGMYDTTATTTPGDTASEYLVMLALGSSKKTIIRLRLLWSNTASNLSVQILTYLIGQASCLTKSAETADLLGSLTYCPLIETFRGRLWLKSCVCTRKIKTKCIFRVNQLKQIKTQI
ncbi:MAG: alginate export family protein [Deltaproteobacteria bacterium]|nr:alginate export family protein [Deltaproteobacteria bacterium]